MHYTTFYPLGNADTTLIQLSKGKNILFDFAHVKSGENEDDKRCNLVEELNKEVTKDAYDVVCFTHFDKDHVVGSEDYFYFDHAQKYQGEGRKKITELWLPAEAIVEPNYSCNDSARVVQAEGRHRLKNNYGIRVFSKPKKLKDWCEKNKNEGYDYEKIQHLIVDAGDLVPSISLLSDGAEFFAHCPFYNEEEEIDRNNQGIVVQCTFDNTYNSKLILGADIGYEVWEEIIRQTQKSGKTYRLQWDLLHISHHCSYNSLASEKGESKTNPSDTLRWLYEDSSQALPGAIMISPSNPIPEVYGAESGEQPPHKQAYNYYNEDAKGTIKVTMEEPSINNPKPLKYQIGSFGVKQSIAAASIGGSRPSERPHRAG